MDNDDKLVWIVFIVSMLMGIWIGTMIGVVSYASKKVVTQWPKGNYVEMPLDKVLYIVEKGNELTLYPDTMVRTECNCLCGD